MTLNSNKLQIQPSNIKIKAINEFFNINDHYWSQDVWRSDNLPEGIDRINEKNRTINFEVFLETSLKNEIKFYLANRVINKSFATSSVFSGIRHSVSRLSKFIQEKYPTLKSFIDIPKESFILNYRTYLINSTNLKVYYPSKNDSNGKYYIRNSYLFTVYNNLYDFYLDYYDDRDEFERDIWRAERLNIDYVKTNSSTKLDFTCIPIVYRPLVKRYIWLRVVNQQSLSFSWAVAYLVRFLNVFFDFILREYPHWKDLKELNRKDIEKFLKHLSTLKEKNYSGKIISNKTKIHTITTLSRFLEDIQLYEWDEAPERNVNRLIFLEDKPKNKKSLPQDIKYVPDNIWEQIMENIDGLDKEYSFILLILEASGFRISDVLGLKIDCLFKDNDQKWWLIGDQRKVKYKDHKVPISDDIARIINIQIAITKEKSNSQNNPDNFLFVRISGIRKGKPVPSQAVQNVINKFMKKYSITEKDGKIHRFKAHSLRHRYGVNLINNGMNLVHVQKLMAHASPEMTLVYAQIHDNTLRDQYFKAKNLGAVRLDTQGKIIKADFVLQAEENGLELEWIRHNFDSIRMDHGICVKSPKVNCDFLEQTLEPPCIANNCRSFHVDRTFSDYYKVQIEKLENDIEIYNRTGKERSLQFAVNKRDHYKKILKGIEQNGGIFGTSKEIREYNKNESK
ncbi:tyrosine-type recombinase/integrase [Psychrobacillus sp. FSL K6-2365]|uniref:tyrosine-type recombinase/integrase n=1 Tax=Psychrobacillus sp. FSL K6-2365 TaxID=2921546 RepID=UPI0030F83E7C